MLSSTASAKPVSYAWVRCRHLTDRYLDVGRTGYPERNYQRASLACNASSPVHETPTPDDRPPSLVRCRKKQAPGRSSTAAPQSPLAVANLTSLIPVA